MMAPRKSGGQAAVFGWCLEFFFFFFFFFLIKIYIYIYNCFFCLVSVVDFVDFVWFVHYVFWFFTREIGELSLHEIPFIEVLIS